METKCLDSMLRHVWFVVILLTGLRFINFKPMNIMGIYVGRRSMGMLKGK